jgi:hypothetical protein
MRSHAVATKMSWQNAQDILESKSNSANNWKSDADNEGQYNTN